MDLEFEKFMGSGGKPEPPALDKKEVIVDLTPYTAEIHKSDEKNQFGSSNKSMISNSSQNKM